MGELNKMCLALGSVCLLLGCSAPLQETTQIKCTSSDGQFSYTGPYDEENAVQYIVQLDDSTLAFYGKGLCQKVRG